jgi:hypothetical protein
MDKSSRLNWRRPCECIPVSYVARYVQLDRSHDWLDWAGILNSGFCRPIVLELNLLI